MNEIEKSEVIEKLIQDFHLLEDYSVDVNQSALASYCGVSKKTVSRWMAAYADGEAVTISEENLNSFDDFVRKSKFRLPQPMREDNELEKLNFYPPEDDEDLQGELLEEVDEEDEYLVPFVGFYRPIYVSGSVADRVEEIQKIRGRYRKTFRFFNSLTPEVRDYFLDHRHIFVDVKEADKIFIKAYREASEEKKAKVVDELKTYTFPMYILLDKAWNEKMRECMELIHLDPPEFETRAEKSERNLNKEAKPQKSEMNKNANIKALELIVPLVKIGNYSEKFIYERDEFRDLFEAWMKEILSYTKEEWYIIYMLKTVMTEAYDTVDLKLLYEKLK